MLTAANKKKASKIHIDDDLLLCFATLPSTSRDEELEDLLYFILDLYQVHGVEVAVAELDVDEVRDRVLFVHDTQFIYFVHCFLFWVPRRWCSRFENF